MDDKLRILLCEDDENLGMLLREYLQAKGYNADLFPDGEVGFKAFLKSKYDLVVTDVMMLERMVLLWRKRFVRQMQKFLLFS